MPDYDALKEIPGKTVKGVMVKKKIKHGTPAMFICLVFSDDTAYEIYDDSHEFTRPGKAFVFYNSWRTNILKNPRYMNSEQVPRRTCFP